MLLVAHSLLVKCSGLYYGDHPRVALQYSSPAPDGSIFLFVCAVALGKPHATTVDMDHLEQAPYGASCHSVW